MVVCWALVGIWAVLLTFGTLSSGKIPWDGVVVGGLFLALMGALSLVKWILFGSKSE